MMQMQLGLMFHKSFHSLQRSKSKEYGIDLSKDITNDEKMGQLGEKWEYSMVSECADTFYQFCRPVWSC